MNDNVKIALISTLAIGLLITMAVYANEISEFVASTAEFLGKRMIMIGD